MGFKRTMWAILCNLVAIVTLDRYYICDACHKIHKHTKDGEMELRGRIFVSYECANRTIKKAGEALRNSVLGKKE